MLYQIRKSINGYRPDFLGNKWRFNANPQITTEQGKNSFSFCHAYWQEMLECMKSTSNNACLVFVYVPTVPRICNNTLTCLDETETIASEFARICTKNNVGFINLKEKELAFYKSEKQFIRGFPTSMPGEGHCNEAGHKMIGKAVYDYLQKSHILCK